MQVITQTIGIKPLYTRELWHKVIRLLAMCFTGKMNKTLHHNRLHIYNIYTTTTVYIYILDISYIYFHLIYI